MTTLFQGLFFAENGLTREKPWDLCWAPWSNEGGNSGIERQRILPMRSADSVMSSKIKSPLLTKTPFGGDRVDSQNDSSTVTRTFIRTFTSYNLTVIDAVFWYQYRPQQLLKLL